MQSLGENKISLRDTELRNKQFASERLIPMNDYGYQVQSNK